MPEYTLLIRPSANRVYAAATLTLLRSELIVFNSDLLGNALQDIGETTLGGLTYVTAGCVRALTESDVVCLSNISALYALFEKSGDMLLPVTLRTWDRHDDDLVSIQRYPGKTNELFTKLLLNVTLASSPRTASRLAAGDRVKVLDPLCGRGTTLNQALMYGMDASGIEIDARDVEAYRAFIRTWLKDKRFKHRAKPSPGRRLTVSFHPKDGGREQVVDIVNDDTINCHAHFPKSGFDLIVADLPYGIQHGTQRDLLAAALPQWRTLLKGGGAMGLAWNTRTLDRKAIEAALAEVDLVVRDLPTFEHRVDRMITRDLVVARKPS